MYSTKDRSAAVVSLRQWLTRAIRQLGSLKLAVLLLATLAAVIAAATVVEADHGRAYAQWYVYQSGWFIALLVLLGVNIFSAAAVRWPWKRRHTGFVVTHCGLLILLGGSIQTFLKGIEGQVTLVEGQSATKMILPRQSQITAVWEERPNELPYEFAFEHGPVDWREGKALNIGEVDGVGARVLRYYRHARAVEEWVPDENNIGGPAVKLRIEAPHGGSSGHVIEHFLVDQDYGDEVFVGPLRLSLQQAVADVMLEDFLNPTPDELLGENGLLLAYYQDQVRRIAVQENVGERVKLGDDGTTVEIVKYLPNARPDAHGRFTSTGETPRNPMLELRVYPPDRKEPFRQLAFAKSPLLNLDPIYGRVSPVRFHFLHAAIKPATAVEFLQTGDGQLYSRVFSDSLLVSSGQAEAGQKVQLPGNVRIALAEHMPHARAKVVFQSEEVEPDEADKPEAAAEVAISAAGVTRTVWLQRNHPAYGTRTIVTPEGTLSVRFGYGEAPLGFSLRLVRFNQEKNPGGVGNASFSSVVRVIDTHQGVDEERTISMNEPLSYNRLRLYQSGFNEGGHGADASTFSVAHDPGRVLKYAGSLMICLGIVIMFYMRAYFFKNVSWLSRKGHSTARVAPVSDGESSTPEGENTVLPSAMTGAGAAAFANVTTGDPAAIDDTAANEGPDRLVG